MIGNGKSLRSECRRYRTVALAMALLALNTAAQAELLFRGAQAPDATLRAADFRNYANPNDTAYPRKLADGGEIATERVQVLLRGQITQDDVYGAKVMESLVKRGRQKIAGNVVLCASEGGDVDAAMQLGRILRQIGVSTLVPRGEQCLSSCVFAFMGGDQRTVAGQLGIHRPYFASARKAAERRTQYRQLQRRLRDYIEDLDFPSSLYEAVMAVPPESVRLLGASELKRYYLQGMSPAAEEEMDAAAARHLGLSVSAYLQRKDREQNCGQTLAGAQPCVPLDSGTAANDDSAAGLGTGGTARSPGEAQGLGPSRAATGSSWVAH